MKKGWIIVILLLGLSLRIWGIGFGLPFLEHIDEGALIFNAWYMAIEVGRPAIYVHGTVFPGIVAFFSGLYYLLGRGVGWFVNPNQFLIEMIKDPTVVFLFGRLTNVVISLVAVLLIYLIGKRLYNRRVGLLAALFLAICPVFVQEAHYAKPDVLAGFIGLLLLWVSSSILERENIRDYLTTGILFSLGVATKSSMALVLPTILLAHFLRKRHELKRWKVIFIHR